MATELILKLTKEYDDFVKSLPSYNQFQTDMYYRETGGNRDYKSWSYHKEGTGMYERYSNELNEQKVRFLEDIMLQLKNTMSIEDK